MARVLRKVNKGFSDYFSIPDEYLPDVQKYKPEERRECVLRGPIARREYRTAKPVAADMDASQRSSFQEK
jgi:hypothetical protein